MLTEEQVDRQPWSPNIETSSAPALSIESEFALWMKDKDALEFFIREGIENGLLYTPQVKNIYQFAKHHYQVSGNAPALPTLQIEFPNYNWAEPQTEYQWLVEKLRERYQRNAVDDLTLELAKRVENPSDAMGYLRSQFIEIERTTLSQTNTFQPGDHTLFIKQLQEKILAGQYKGASIGYQQIDDFTGGLRPGQIGYLLARPKRQKTFHMLKAFIEQAEQGMKPILYTLELTDDEIKLRLSCMLSGVPWDRAQRGELMNTDYKDIENAWEEFNADGKKYWIDMPKLDERTVPALVLKADKLGAESLLFSQFKYIRGSAEYYRGPYDEPAEVAISLKQACIKPGAERPFYVEAQFNRGGDTMAELEDFDAGKVGLTDMIPQSADILYGLFQNRDMRSSNQVEFGVVESRNTDRAAWYIRSEFKTTTEFELQSGSEH
jgi:hypothetical protein